MKSLFASAIVLTVFAAPVFAQSNPSDHYVGGYTTGRGTYVEPHYQTNPNSTREDNYGTSGNYNPHTGGYGSRSSY